MNVACLKTDEIWSTRWCCCTTVLTTAVTLCKGETIYTCSIFLKIYILSEFEKCMLGGSLQNMAAINPRLHAAEDGNRS